MKRMCWIYLIILFCSISCKKNQDSKGKPLATITLDQKKESQKEESNTASEELNSRKNQDTLATTRKKDFIIALKKQSIEPLPLSFASFLLDSLHKESYYDDLLFELAFKENDSSLVLNNLNKDLNHNLTVEKIHNDTEPFAPNYYSMLINICNLSTSYFYKRLPKLNDTTEVFLAATKLQDRENDFIRGLVFELFIIEVKSGTIINKKRIFTGGIAEYDNGYYEGFKINSDYSIQIKSYVGFEGESTTIDRKLKVLPDGKIIEERKPIVVTEYSEEEYN